MKKKFKMPPMVKGAYYGSFENWLPESKIADIICAVCAAEWDEVQHHACGRIGHGRIYDEAVKNREEWLKLRRKILEKRNEPKA